jgi:hypothetical protein
MKQKTGFRDSPFTVHCSLFTVHRSLFTLLTLFLLAAFAPQAQAGVAATGGTMTTNGMYIVHTFTTVGSNSFNVSSGGNVEVLVVAGGGGGGYWGTQGAGGGAGGVINNTAFAVVGGSNYTVTVGAGGLGSWGHNAINDRLATSGSNSVFGSITALGGGNGGGGGQAAGSGIGVVGSGGGGSPGGGAAGVGTPGQGNSGGAGQPNANFGQGGGGGAGANGQAGTTTYGGAGGIGRYFSAFANWGDTSHLGYFGGGGGGCYRNGSATGGGTGGWGGGGTGGNQGGSPLNNGQANTGGGGGGADWNGASSVTAGDGGSGIVIVRYVGTAMPSQMKITFGGYTNRSEVLTNFPVLVVFSHNINNSGFTFANFATTNGYDLRFGTDSKPPTIGLNYEIESWNPNGASYVWVQVPTIPTNGTGAIWANWGDTSASSQLPCTTNGATWNSDYRAVWHLQQTGTGSAGDYKDSTSNANNSTNTANQPTFISGGKIGGAQSFTNASILVSDSTSLRPTNITLEAWFTISSPGGNPFYYSILGKDYSSSSPYLSWLVRVMSLTSIEYDVGNGTTYSGIQYTVPTLAVGVWHHVAMTYNGTTCIGYFDGAKVGNNTTVSGNIAYAAKPAYIGGGLNGNVDEVRVSSTPASSNWVWACYQTMANNTTFNNYGAMVKQAAPKGTVIMMR